MAKNIPFKLMPIRFLLLLLLLTLHFERIVPHEVEDKEEKYVLDSIYSKTNTPRRSRFLSSTIKKSTQCGAKDSHQVCNGVWANKGTSLLYCCKNYCRDVLSDNNNCGRCGKKCSMGRLCCNGVCVHVLKDKNNCGQCNKKCPQGVKCELGYCGYA